MSRPLRIEYPGAWYHVMNRGRRREKVFTASEDYESFLVVLQETSKLLNLKVAAYCLMPNHYHLLLHTPDGNISRCMRHVNGVYTQRFNRTHNKDGQLFRGRYKAVVVDNDSYLLEVLRYIHRNPVRAGIVDTADDFIWSSHRGYMAGARKWDWLYKDFLLAMFSKESNQAMKTYAEFIKEQVPKEIENFYNKKNLPSILGDDNFKEWIKEKFKNLRFSREIPESKALALDSEAIRDLVCKEFGVENETLMQLKRGTENPARDVAVYLQRKYCGQTLARLGKDYGIDNYSSVSSAYERVKTRLLKDHKMRTKIVKIEKILDKGQRKI
jgi:putative transposase